MPEVAYPTDPVAFAWREVNGTPLPGLLASGVRGRGDGEPEVVEPAPRESRKGIPKRGYRKRGLDRKIAADCAEANELHGV
jgi:hypothetical protein